VMQGAGGDLNDPTANLFVAVRLRPARGVECSSEQVVMKVDDRVVAFEPPRDENFGPNGAYSVPGSRAPRNLQYAFDSVFGPEASSEEVYAATTPRLLNGVLEGFNATVFAYGATGSGKTHTMVGTREQPGVMVHTFRDLFSMIKKREAEGRGSYCISLSYLEIYNETVRDLLTEQEGRSPPLDLREDYNGDIIVAGLSSHSPTNSVEVFQLLDQGNANRSMAPTDANQQSSRSHAVLQIMLQSKDVALANQTLGKLSLIDLAGSERAANTNNRGHLLIEGANINRSLLALGNCINALCSKRATGSYVPYRDSKLTRLLKDSLGGSCRTVMIAAVSPSEICSEDSHNTLKYANRAKDIKLKQKVVRVKGSDHVENYKRIIEELRGEVNRLRAGTPDVSGLSFVPPLPGPNVDRTDPANERQQHVTTTASRRTACVEDVACSDKGLIQRMRSLNAHRQTLQTELCALKMHKGGSDSKVRMVELNSMLLEARQRCENMLSESKAETGCSGCSVAEALRLEANASTHILARMEAECKYKRGDQIAVKVQKQHKQTLSTLDAVWSFAKQQYATLAANGLLSAEDRERLSGLSERVRMERKGQLDTREDASREVNSNDQSAGLKTSKLLNSRNAWDGAVPSKGKAVQGKKAVSRPVSAVKSNTGPQPTQKRPRTATSTVNGVTSRRIATARGRATPAKASNPNAAVSQVPRSVPRVGEKTTVSGREKVGLRKRLLSLLGRS